jgi:hypothetical protein
MTITALTSYEFTKDRACAKRTALRGPVIEPELGTTDFAPIGVKLLNPWEAQ